MHHLIKPIKTRRDMLIGLGATGVGIVAGPALGGDRPMISTGRSTACNNAGVLVSDTSGRTSAVADFADIGSCRLSRGSVEGPYFICTDTKNARNIAEGLAGAPMTLALRVTDQECTPIPGAIVDVWQCDCPRKLLRPCREFRQSSKSQSGRSSRTGLPHPIPSRCACR